MKKWLAMHAADIGIAFAVLSLLAAIAVAVLDNPPIIGHG